MLKKILILMILAIIFISSCSKSPDKAAKVEMIEGIEYIHNPETPLFPERKLLLTEELDIRNEDEEGNVILYRPGWFVVDRQGKIYAPDYQERCVKAFDPDGRFIQTIGKEGSGPGEFQNIGEIALLPDDSPLVLDWEAKRISIFNPDGDFVTSHKYKNWSYDIFLTTDSIYVRDERIFGPETQLLINAYDFSGKELFSFGHFTPSHSQFINEGGVQFSVSLPFDVHSIKAGDQKNKWLYHCLNDKFLIEVFDINGKIFRKIDRPYKLLPVMDADKTRYLDGFSDLSENERRAIEKNVEMPKVKTVMDRMLVDDEGSLWIETHEEQDIDGQVLTAYDIFNEKGFYAARVWLEVRPLFFMKGKIYSYKTDEETGYRTLMVYRMHWSE